MSSVWGRQEPCPKQSVTFLHYVFFQFSEKLDIGFFGKLNTGVKSVFNQLKFPVFPVMNAGE